MRDPVLDLSRALAEAADTVHRDIAGLGPVESERALFFLMSAYDLATEMWFQKGDATAPVLTNWERPWRKLLTVAGNDDDGVGLRR